ncbi:TrbC/VirB2 family protein [Sphingomonas sp. ZT3P38]|uniref:TrbC/VirB2 family protein n=1 Tax=Parasphingomonas zepuensis TaxID=3096161 RepID=UPI003FA746E8
MTVLTGISAPLTDPSGANPLTSAVQWLQATLLGTVATTIAVIAVASVGIMMLTGRVDLRRGATVIIGCFLLFGASSIAAGIRSAAEASFGTAIVERPPPIGAAPPGFEDPPRPALDPADDPYAGASVRR